MLFYVILKNAAAKVIIMGSYDSFCGGFIKKLIILSKIDLIQ